MQRSPTLPHRIQVMTEAQLIERAGTGDREAIRQLYERYEPWVFAVVRRISGEHELARDHAQEVWLRVIQALPSFRGEAKFSTWLHRIAVNVALQAARKARAGSAREVAVPESLTAAELSDDALLAHRLEEGLSLLPEGMRRVLVLHEVEGFTHEEIAELLGVSVGTSRSQLFRARLKMRAILTNASPKHPEGVNA